MGILLCCSFNLLLLNCARFQTPKGICAMAHYVMLLKFTDQGIRNVKDTTKRAAAFSETASKMGAKINTFLWTLGQYDLVAMAEAPNDEDRKSTRLNSSHLGISYAVFCLK